MKIRILKVSESSAHFGNNYDLVGIIGDANESPELKQDGTTYLSLSNCQVLVEAPDEGVINGMYLNVFVDKYEVVEK